VARWPAAKAAPGRPAGPEKREKNINKAVEKLFKNYPSTTTAP
jgi:hypothetical protein